MYYPYYLLFTTINSSGFPDTLDAGVTLWWTCDSRKTVMLLIEINLWPDKQTSTSLHFFFWINFQFTRYVTYPSPNLTSTLLALGKMLGLGRGRWAVSLKHTLVQNFFHLCNIQFFKGCCMFLSVHWRCLCVVYYN